MRAPNRRFSSLASIKWIAPRSRRKLGRGAPNFVHALTVLILFAGLLSPMMATASPAPSGSRLTALKDQKPNTPPPFPAPNRVVVAGTFQAALGCPQDFDKTCDITALQNNNDGTWSANIPVPPGDYTFRVVASSDIDRSFGEGGDPDGGDIQTQRP